MKSFFRYILLLCSASLVLSLLGSCRDSRVIDEEDMAKIYAEMLMTDQWINSTPNVRMMADTSLVYEPILKKYGYTVEDYRYSVDYYIEHHQDFADIMKQTVRILDARKHELEKKKARLEEEKRLADYVKSISDSIRIDESMFYVDDIHEPYSYDDSLAIEWDTLSDCFTIRRIPRDSLHIRDSLVIRKDTLQPVKQVRPDTLRIVKDTVGNMDRFKGMKPVPRSADFDKQKIHHVKDAYLNRL